MKMSGYEAAVVLGLTLVLGTGCGAVESEATQTVSEQGVRDEEADSPMTSDREEDSLMTEDGSASAEESSVSADPAEETGFHITASAGFSPESGQENGQDSGQDSGTKTIMIYMMGSDLESGNA
ncbi:MAG: hypothetical protein Q4B15_07805, partial [Lachnospiraceae bacterium]|nr:hypothetical protein [Lachnospiraceae bacterium]